MSAPTRRPTVDGFLNAVRLGHPTCDVRPSTPIGLLPKYIQKHSLVRRARRLPVLHHRPCNFVGSPHVRDLSGTADVCRRHHQLRDLRRWSIRRKPVFVQSFLSDPWSVAVWRQQHAVLREQSPHAIRVSLEPGLFVLGMHFLYFLDVFRGKRAATASSDHRS